MTVPLLCLPYAGAGASLFRQWKRHSFEQVHVVPVQLPGREELFAEKPCTTMGAVVARCVRRARDWAEDGPFALFGHSFGALVAYETAQHLIAEGLHPEHLIVSGVAAPWLPRPHVGVDSLSDDLFVERVRELVGYDHPALHDPELRGLLLPALRADMGISDRYVPTCTVPLPIPVTVLRGTDDEMVSRQDAALWSKASTVDSELIDMPGGHMYFSEDWQPLWTELDAVFTRRILLRQ